MIRLASLLLLLTLPAFADSGVLIPRDKQSPDPAILSLEEMQVHITIDNGDAHVRILQIFANHTARIEEGTYRFSLPGGSTVSDFAVWDGPVRIPAVILERKRAEELYDQARLQAIDPGLLEPGERDDATPRQSALFTARITPIPPYGTKRLELDYHQRLPVTDFAQFFALPLRPDANARQSAHRFTLLLELHSAHPIRNFQAPSHLFPLTLQTSDPHTVIASFTAADLSLDEDFQATWTLTPTASDHLEILTHRDPTSPLPTPGSQPPPRGPTPPEPGFFDAQLLLADPKTTTQTQTPRTLILLFDNSLSMQWEKLERTYAALESILRTLTPADRFNLLLFNHDATPFQPAPIPATPASVQAALDFVRAAKLRGGTDLLKALDAGLAQAKSERDPTHLILLSDGGSNRGASILPGKIAAAYTAHWRLLPHPPKTEIFAVGDDANLPLLRLLAHNDGLLEVVLSTEPPDFHLKSFLSKLRRDPVTVLALTPSDPARTALIYPLDDSVYPGSIAEWVGQYTPAPTPLTLTVRGSRAGTPFTAEAVTPLPTLDPAHPQLPRLWAQARVGALLAGIARDGETAAAIAEIIRLSRRYKFVTPYTSFLAVPRSLLRPRVIRPGDPVLRVRTDPAITSVIALFPFGLTKPLRHLASEDTQHSEDDANRLWETRFLAPPDMKDGTYTVRLILRDTHGNTYNEGKTFVIASTPPTVKLQLPRTEFHRGETLELRASASASTRTLTARLQGTAPVALRWNERLRTNSGLLPVPPDLPIGRYTLTITAEDIAHNLGTQEVTVDVIP